MTLLFSFTFGWFGWSFTEYVMHRFVGHKKGAKQTFAKEHIRHHATAGYFTPTTKKIWLSARVLVPFWCCAVAVFGIAIGSAVLAGFTASYATYEIMHYMFHSFPPRTSAGAWLRKHHFWHHYHNPNRNHGVTSPLWDIVFGTRVPAEQVRVPEQYLRKSMPWLIDEDTGEIKDVYRNDYSIRRRTRRQRSVLT